MLFLKEENTIFHIFFIVLYLSRILKMATILFIHSNILNFMVYSGNTIVCLDLRLHRVRTNVLNLLDFFFYSQVWKNNFLETLCFPEFSKSSLRVGLLNKELITS